MAPDLVMPELTKPERLLDGQEHLGVRVDLLWIRPVLAEQELLARVAPLDVPSNRVHHVAWEGEHEDLIVFAWDELRRPLFEPFLYRPIDDELGLATPGK